MGKNKSSFQMGNQFNGYGDTVYIKADTIQIPPISQDNITLTPDYSPHALKATGGNPRVLNPENSDASNSAMLGSVAEVNHVEIVKNKADGEYLTGFRVSSNGFIANSYPNNTLESKSTTKSYDIYFAVTAQRLKVRRERTRREDPTTLITQIESGQQIKVVTVGKYKSLITAEAEDDTNDYTWVQVSCMPHEDYKHTEDGSGEVEGWVPRMYIRRDIKKTLYFNEIYNYMEVNFYYKFKNTQDNIDAGRIGEIKKTVNSMAKWGIVGGGDYDYPVGKTYGKWNVAVGPGILDWEYPLTGKVLDDDVKGFSKFIRVYLCLKDKYRQDTTKSKTQVIECYVKDLKAHSYSIYPYQAHVLNTEGRGTKEYISDFVEKAWASAASGLIQTGIKYPNVPGEDRLIVGYDNMDGSIIEFYGNSISGLGFELDEYQLDCIEVNYESTTRGEEIIK